MITIVSKYQDYYQRYPDKFIEEYLGVSLYPLQRLIIRSFYHKNLKFKNASRKKNYVADSLNIISDNREEFILEFEMCDGNKGKYEGTTKQIREQLDNHKWDYSLYYHRWNNNGNPTYKKEWELENISQNLSILKYGYFWEFKEKYTPCEYTIDNALSIKIIRRDRRE